MRVYADASVYGGAFDEEFESYSRRFFELIRGGRFYLVTSALVYQALHLAPVHVQEFYRELSVKSELISITDEVLALRDAYIDAGILTEKSLTDATHVAVATLSRCDLIVSWNFKHIVNFKKIPMYNAVNILRNCGQISIHSPQEVIEIDSEDF
ncbi:MAG: hypothetical protein IT210_03250 [Armatimonadetes bacterium]|nr:hypothetical protein [Armatimonadota bacterium]